MNSDMNSVRSGDRVAINKMSNDIIDKYSGLVVGGIKPVSKTLNGVKIGNELRGAINSFANNTRRPEIDDVNNLMPIFDRSLRDLGKRRLSKMFFNEKLQSVAKRLAESTNDINKIPIFLKNK